MHQWYCNWFGRHLKAELSCFREMFCKCETLREKREDITIRMRCQLFLQSKDFLEVHARGYTKFCWFETRKCKIFFRSNWLKCECEDKCLRMCRALLLQLKDDCWVCKKGKLKRLLIRNGNCWFKFASGWLFRKDKRLRMCCALILGGRYD